MTNTQTSLSIRVNDIDYSLLFEVPDQNFEIYQKTCVGQQGGEITSKAPPALRNIPYSDTERVSVCEKEIKAIKEQTWLADADAKGTLVADVVAADTAAGEAPCIMGTFKGKMV